ncbi:GntR family transcriptional regulator [Cryobacterium roopkundense]|uniref:DNA-binding FadR family transcriptional regulator n=1 Tax=Cryobacterium roopkundense TaxID=1001240 RepID=A0A099JHJ6_9MICO|nr:FadR/GntR family transcriptional regulator [Cryobacterium roopkundense]KGJ77545.1 GntR family transcriptional regulator [Cryobacterium roopkundense]MBB5640720.1 DNA-binding FadR family transcriptional regulator [Cryobacterium roopkundense]
MARKSLVDVVVDLLLEQILRGEIAAHEALPPEAEIARTSGVSQLTVREALKSLQAQNIISVRRGLGTFVNPTDVWTGIDAILLAASRDTSPDEAATRLLEVRRMVETGASELAATNYTADDLERMDAAIREMESAHGADDVEALVTADLAFHDAVLRSSGNPFVLVLMSQLGRLLYDVRRRTSAHREVQRHAIEHHRIVREAISGADPEAARKAMEAHLDQTFEDYARYIRVTDR